MAVVDYTLPGCAGDTRSSPRTSKLYYASCQSGFRYPVLQAVDHNCKPFLPSAIFPVQVYTQNTGWATNPFALFGSEYSAISTGIVGLKANGQKTISLQSNKPMTTVLVGKPAGTQ